MSGQHHSWSGEYVLDDAGDLENGDIIPLNISYADNSGMNGNDISEADDGALTFCDAEVTTCQCFQKIFLVYGKMPIKSMLWVLALMKVTPPTGMWTILN